jgi:hypothetical protein
VASRPGLASLLILAGHMAAILKKRRNFDLKAGQMLSIIRWIFLGV